MKDEIEPEKSIQKEEFQEIPLPKSFKDLEKILPLEDLPNEIFEKFVTKISENLEKIPLEVLSFLVPQIINNSRKIPSTRAIGIIQPIVKWEAALHNFKNKLRKAEWIKGEAQAICPREKPLLILAGYVKWLPDKFYKSIIEATERDMEIFLPKKPSLGEELVMSYLQGKKIPFALIELDENLSKILDKKFSFYILSQNTNELKAIDDINEMNKTEVADAKLEIRRRVEILSRLEKRGKKWKSIEEIKEDIIQDVVAKTQRLAQNGSGRESEKKKTSEKIRRERIYKKVILISLGFLFLLAIFFRKIFGYLFVLIFFLWIFSSKRRFQWFRSISKLFR